MAKSLPGSNSAEFKVIIPKKVNVPAMITKMVEAAQQQGKKMQADLDKTTKTWQGEKPTFQAEVKINPLNAPSIGQIPKEVKLVVGAKDDKSRGAKKWSWLNLGTRVRRAVMSKPFTPKTRIGVFNSFKGKGKMVFVSKKIELPGIKARGWEKALKKKWDKSYVAAMRKAMGLVAKASGHHYPSASHSAPVPASSVSIGEMRTVGYQGAMPEE